MSNFMVVHAGTGTYFSVDSDAYVIDVSKLTDQEFNQFFEDEDLDPVIEKCGVKLSDQFFEKALVNGEMGG